MFDEFKKLHDNRESDSIQYFSFYDNNGDLIRGDIEVSIDDNGQFDTLVNFYNEEDHIYPKGTYQAFL